MLYKYAKDDSADLSLCSEATLSTQDRPKRVKVYKRIAVCVTTIQNKLLVWRVDDNLYAEEEPFEFVKNRYSLVSTLSTVPTGANHRVSAGARRNRYNIDIPLHLPLQAPLHPRHHRSLPGAPPQRRRMVIHPSPPLHRHIEHAENPPTQPPHP